MLPRGRAGVSMLGYAGFAPVTEPQYGNVSGWTGSPGNTPAVPGPHPATQPLGGQVGRNDGNSGADPARNTIQPAPASTERGAWSEGDAGSAPGPAGQPLGHAYGAARTPSAESDGGSSASRLGRPGGDPLNHGRPSFWRGGIQGYNDQLQVRDRHAYWEAGKQRFQGNPYTGSQMSGRNPQLDGKPRASLKTVNISVNPQMGSDHTSFADDLSRPYTWLGQQDGTRQVIYGGVPGLWQSYGNRGFSDHIHDPSNGEGGPMMVHSGPPHGLHSNTIADTKQWNDRMKAIPQMRPVRMDRPDNSRIAGQSYSQTVQFQGQTGAGEKARSGHSFGLNFGLGGGWKGSQ